MADSFRCIISDRFYNGGDDMKNKGYRMKEVGKLAMLESLVERLSSEIRNS